MRNKKQRIVIYALLKNYIIQDLKNTSMWINYKLLSHKNIAQPIHDLVPTEKN